MDADGFTAQFWSTRNLLSLISHGLPGRSLLTTSALPLRTKLFSFCLHFTCLYPCCRPSLPLSLSLRAFPLARCCCCCAFRGGFAARRMRDAVFAAAPFASFPFLSLPYSSVPSLLSPAPAETPADALSLSDLNRRGFVRWRGASAQRMLSAQERRRLPVACCSALFRPLTHCGRIFFASRALPMRRATAATPFACLRAVCVDASPLFVYLSA